MYVSYICQTDLIIIQQVLNKIKIAVKLFITIGAFIISITNV